MHYNNSDASGDTPHERQHTSTHVQTPYSYPSHTMPHTFLYKLENPPIIRRITSSSSSSCDRILSDSCPRVLPFDVRKQETLKEFCFLNGSLWTLEPRDIHSANGNVPPPLRIRAGSFHYSWICTHITGRRMSQVGCSRPVCPWYARKGLRILGPVRCWSWIEVGIAWICRHGTQVWHEIVALPGLISFWL